GAFWSSLAPLRFALAQLLTFSQLSTACQPALVAAGPAGSLASRSSARVAALVKLSGVFRAKYCATAVAPALWPSGVGPRRRQRDSLTPAAASASPLRGSNSASKRSTSAQAGSLG